MKKALLSLLFVVFSTSSIFAQFDKAISADPIDLLVSKVFNFTYEQKMSPTNSFTVFGSYYNYSDYWSAYGIGASYRWYLKDVIQDDRTPISGLSVGPMARVSFWDYTGPNPLNLDYGGTMVVVGGEVAYKFNDLFGKGSNFFVEPIVRLGFIVSDIDYLGYDALGFGVNIGYGW
ncbi:MAG: hypothetical protein N3A67_04375 [Ignavibacteria bacterium]|nr:hypothetical protein [Ignavibacteria bacterium]